MRIVYSTLALVVLLGGPVGIARGADTDMAAQIEAAATPEQHRALAAEYQAKASESRERAEMHRRMADRYAQGKSVLSQGPHCLSIAKRLDENAADYDALAAAHAEQAKK